MKETLSKAQWLIMEALWNRSPMFLSEIMEALEGQVSWTHTTFLTYLKKLVQEGFVSFETVRGSRLYAPAVSREDCVAKESRSMLSRMTESSRALFVSNMIKEGSLTKKDRNDLRDLIDELSEQEDD